MTVYVPREKKPHILLLIKGSAKFSDPRNDPWTTPKQRTAATKKTGDLKYIEWAL
jgi:hypothetical protein